MGCRTLATALVILAGAPTTGSAEDRAWRDCGGSDLGQIIAGCTAVLVRRSGQEAADRASAYGFRGLAHEQRGEFAPALADYEASLATGHTMRTVLEGRERVRALSGGR